MSAVKEKRPEPTVRAKNRPVLGHLPTMAQQEVDHFEARRLYPARFGRHERHVHRDERDEEIKERLRALFGRRP